MCFVKTTNTFIVWIVLRVYTTYNNALFMRVNNTQATHSGRVYSRDYVIDYNSLEKNDIVVFADGEFVQQNVYKQSTDGHSERLMQLTDTAPGQNGNGGFERTLYVHEDVQGNTRYYTKATGQTFAELQYDAWGQPLSPNKLINNDHGNFVAANYTGHPYDTVIDMYFAEARFYDAIDRQWMSRDPAKDGLNWYQYCGSNPTSRWDPTGLRYAEGPPQQAYLDRLEAQREQARERAMQNATAQQMTTGGLTPDQLAELEQSGVTISAGKPSTNRYFGRVGCGNAGFTLGGLSIAQLLVWKSYSVMVDTYLDGKGLKTVERALVKLHPVSALIVNQTRSTAHLVHSQMFGAGTDGRRDNAYLHAYWNALMAYYLGDRRAEQFATAHETYVGDEIIVLNEVHNEFLVSEHVTMDLYNNNIGRSIGDSLARNSREPLIWLMDRYGSQEKIEEMSELYGGVHGAELVLAIQVMDALTEDQLTYLADS